jgi:hypothetical protein
MTCWKKRMRTTKSRRKKWMRLRRTSVFSKLARNLTTKKQSISLLTMPRQLAKTKMVGRLCCGQPITEMSS